MWDSYQIKFFNRFKRGCWKPLQFVTAVTINEATVSVSFCVMFVKNWKSSEAVKPFLLSLFVNPLLLAWREMKQVVFSIISIYHIKGDIEFFWYQFVILKSSRFYYAPLTCFLKFNPKLAICQERLILRFDRTILFYSPSLIFFKCPKEVYQAYKHVVSDAYIYRIWHVAFVC